MARARRAANVHIGYYFAHPHPTTLCIHLVSASFYKVSITLICHVAERVLCTGIYNDLCTSVPLVQVHYVHSLCEVMKWSPRVQTVNLCYVFVPIRILSKIFFGWGGGGGGGSVLLAHGHSHHVLGEV